MPRGPDNPRRYIRRGGFSTQREAQAALDELLASVRVRVPQVSDAATMAPYLTSWLAGKAALRDTSRRAYEAHLRLYLLPGLGHLRLSELDVEHLDAVYAAMNQLGHLSSGRPSPTLQRLLDARRPSDPINPLTDATIRRVHSTLRAALN